MSDFFNDRVVSALLTGNYTCSKCGSKMEFIDDCTLYCSACGTELDYDRYGFENDEDYDALYPTEDEVD